MTLPRSIGDLPEIIYVRGGDKRAPDVAQRGGMRYGVRHDYMPYAPIYMLDIHWLDYDWREYLAKVRTLRPVQAMVADYERPEQRSLMNRQIVDLMVIGIKRIMVCAKFPGAVGHIPDFCIIAVSVPTNYAGFLPAPGELTGRQIHLLGGHPDQQLFLMQRYREAGGEVVSVDGNELGFKAQMGQFWRKSGGWQDERNKGHKTDDLAVRSALNIRAYFEANRSVFRSRRVTKCMYSGVML